MNNSLKAVIICSIILLLIFLSTDPKELPSVILISPFVLIFVALLAGIVTLLGLYGSLSSPRKLKVGLVGAAIPVILLVLQSLGQLTVRDVLAIFVLFGVTYFYISKLSIRSAS